MIPKIKNIIAREATILCLYIVTIFAIALIAINNEKHYNFYVILAIIILFCYPIYLLARLLTWGITTLQAIKLFRGIKIVAVICFLESIMLIIFSLMIIFNASPFSKPRPAPVLYFVIALYIICGLGLLRVKTWSLYFTILLFSYKFIEFLPNIHVYAMGAINPDGFSLLHKIFNACGAGIILLMNTIIPILCVFYLTRPKVREQFK